MHLNKTKVLALNGGTPVASSEEWIKWPLTTEGMLKNIKQVLDNQNWSVGFFDPKNLTFDEIFCERFSKFANIKHVLTVDHGSNAILLALQALDVGIGDEVIVPGLTWIACATAVLRANAIPVLADVEPDTQCISAAQIEEKITPRTRAILVVHLNSCMADMDEILCVSKKYNIPIIEDCAQAHGAEWTGKSAGTMGKIGVFSTERSKLLTSGEGGIVITNDTSLYKKMFLLKNDGRRKGKYHLEEDGSFVGANFSLTEFQAALLCEGIERLPKENQQRAQTAEYLTSLLNTIPGVISMKPYSKNNQRTYFHYNIRYDPEYFNGKNASIIAEALSAELGFWVKTSHSPLNNCPLFQPLKDPKFKHLNLPDYNACELFESKKQNQTTILFHHPSLLSGKKGADKIFEAFTKISALSQQLH